MVNLLFPKLFGRSLDLANLRFLSWSLDVEGFFDTFIRVSVAVNSMKSVNQEFDEHVHNRFVLDHQEYLSVFKLKSDAFPWVKWEASFLYLIWRHQIDMLSQRPKSWTDSANYKTIDLIEITTETRFVKLVQVKLIYIMIHQDLVLDPSVLI